jgi:GlpG protein
MRLIGEFKDERQSFGFQAFLKKEGIQSLYDSTKDTTGQTTFRLWIIEEDDFDKAWAFYLEWQKNPHDDCFEPKQEKVEPSVSKNVPPKWKVRMVRQQVSSFSLNNLIILICGLIFMLNLFQEKKIEQQQGEVASELVLTSIKKTLIFDYSQYFVNFEKFLAEYPVKTEAEIKDLPADGQAAFQKAKSAPNWKGLLGLLMKRSWKGYEQLPKGTLFGKIRQGEIWRLYTPVLLHADWLHILFNMAWVWLLGRQIEQRIGIFRYLILSLVVGIIANIAQYIVSGPEFVGYSGIVIGMVGFIWMRQKIAPWEGYPLNPTIVRFIVGYVAILFVLAVVLFCFDFFHIPRFSVNIANTAHIVGGVAGILLARLPFFSRSTK